MTILIRPVRHQEEGQELLAFLGRNLPGLPHDQRYHWLYRANPDGPALTWFAIESSTREIVGSTSVFPRAMWIGNQVRMCSQVGDFAIATSHRSLGPALLLQRATFVPVDGGKFCFCYDCPPHLAGMSTFRRLGMQANCTVQRYALPLRVNRILGKRFGAAAALPAAVANLVLRAWRRGALRFPCKDLEVSEHVGLFDEDFTMLDEAVGNPNGIRGRRDATHLNWRYCEDPLQKFGVLTARRRGELLAYLVYLASADVVTIVDLFGKEISASSITLIRWIVERFQSSHQAIEMFLSEGCELLRPIRSMGFRHRSMAAQIVAYAGAGSETSAFLNAAPLWALQQLDIRA